MSGAVLPFGKQVRLLLVVLAASGIWQSACARVQFAILFDEAGNHKILTLDGGSDDAFSSGTTDDPTPGGLKGVPSFVYTGNIGSNVATGDAVLNEPGSKAMSDVVRFIHDPARLGPGANTLLFYSDREAGQSATETGDPGLPASIINQAGAPGYDPTQPAAVLMNEQALGNNIYAVLAKDFGAKLIKSPPDLTGLHGLVYVAHAQKKGNKDHPQPPSMPGSPIGDPDIQYAYIFVSDNDVVKNSKIGPTGGDKKPSDKSPAPLPAAGAPSHAKLHFNASTGQLSFTDGSVDFLNLDGSSLADPRFALDPLQGATIHIDDFTADGTQGAGYLFTGGQLTITKGAETFLVARIPRLLVDDSGTVEFGSNLFAPLDITSIDTAASPFLDLYESYAASQAFPEELLCLTPIGIADMIGAGQSFDSSLDVSFSFSFEPVPEPATLAMFGGGLVLLLGTSGARRYRISKHPLQN